MSKLLIALLPLFLLVTIIHSIGYYERNIARKFYWLLGNNLYRLNETKEREDFWKIVDNEKWTKKEILLNLGKWVENKGAYMVNQYERMMNYEKELFKMAEEFQLELVHSSDATKLAKQLYKIHENPDLTWKQTCREKNQAIRLAGKEVQEELKLQLNSWCIPKPKQKKSALSLFDV